MTVNVMPTVGTQNFSGLLRSVQELSQSTATSVTTVTCGNDVLALGAGTASATGGGINNLTALAAGQEGQILYVGLGTTTAATGKASIVFTGTATGQWVLESATDYLKLEFKNDSWYVLDSLGATLSTGT